jgi:hypothetical protein
MSARKRTQTQAVGVTVTPKQIKALESDTRSFIVQEAISPIFDPTRVLQVACSSSTREEADMCLSDFTLLATTKF